VSSYQSNGANGPRAFELRGGEILLNFDVLQHYIKAYEGFALSANILSFYESGFITF
jgi:hypothetical protein